MDEIKMYPLDFEEFVLALGELPTLVSAAEGAWKSATRLDKVYHERLMKLWRLYLVVGGMPAAVQRYLDTRNISLVVREQKKILALYRKDITQYDEKNALRILNGEAEINFGSVYENAVAQELVAHGFDELTYYASNRHGELDFVLEVGDSVLPIEVKSGKRYKRHRALAHVLSDPEYDIPKALVLNDKTVSEEGKIRYVPIYMVMFLKKDTLPDTMIYDVLGFQMRHACTSSDAPLSAVRDLI